VNSFFECRDEKTKHLKRKRKKKTKKQKEEPSQKGLFVIDFFEIFCVGRKTCQ